MVIKGTVKVSGMGVNTHTFAFIHRATAANLSADNHVTTIDNPLTNNNPNVVIFVINNALRSEEHTSERQSLCVISYAVFCLKKKKKKKKYKNYTITTKKIKQKKIKHKK